MQFMSKNDLGLTWTKKKMNHGMEFSFQKNRTHILVSSEIDQLMSNQWPIWWCKTIFGSAIEWGMHRKKPRSKWWRNEDARPTGSKRCQRWPEVEDEVVNWMKKASIGRTSVGTTKNKRRQFLLFILFKSF